MKDKSLIILWTIFAITFASIVIKNILFQWFVFNDLYFGNPTMMFKFYGGVIALSAFLSSPIFVLKKPQWWTLLMLLLIDAWIIAVLVNYRAWGVFMNMETILMADNMKGFWSSILIYFSWKVALFLTITCIASVCVFVFSRNFRYAKRYWLIMLVISVISYTYVPLRQYIPWRNGLNNFKIYNPYSDPIRYQAHIVWQLFKPYRSVCDKAYVSFISGGMAIWEEDYIKKQGIVDYGIAMIVFHSQYKHFYKEVINTEIDTQLSEIEQAFMNSALNEDEYEFYPSQSLIVILVESFESWVIEYKGPSGYAMPNIRKYIDKEHVFYANKITSQVKYGNSGDGQLLVLTGLLPISSGAACRLYGTNTYPNYAHYYPYSITINPSAGAWNQAEVNPQYGITELYEDGNMSNDSLVLAETLKKLRMKDSPQMILAITISSHAPFTMADNIDFITEPDMPENMSNYIKCMHYFDTQFGLFEDSVRNKNVDVVITGDHTIFKQMMLEEMKSYAQEHGIEHIRDGSNYCPLIIFSQNIENKTRYENVCYQMDIYPTIVGMLNVKPKWMGFGINLLSTDSTRHINIADSEILSDKLIRKNYFKNIH